MLNRNTKIFVNGKEYDSFHGGPFDRGSADSYYHRSPRPHWYPEGTVAVPYPGRVEREQMTDEQVEAYYAGYAYNESLGSKKDYE